MKQSTRRWRDSKNPWRWLLYSDKGVFTILWIIAGTVATSVSWEYDYLTIIGTIVFWGAILGVIIAYRVGRYKEAVRSMDIISFSKWQQLKDQGAI